MIQQLNHPKQAADWLRSKVVGELQTDSRKVQAGDGFIAWPGATLDGRQFVLQTLSQGASACLVEQQGMSPTLNLSDAEAGVEGDVVSAKVASYLDLKKATGLIAAAYYEDPSRQLDVIAVTGTNGKTSSVWWLAQALSSLKNNRLSQCGMIGTLGVGQPLGLGGNAEHTGDIVFNGLTTPDPVQLQKAFKKFVASGFTACAIEASSIGIAEHRLAGTAIKVAVFTNFTQDHLDYHGSMAAYWQTKEQLFAWPNLQAAVVNVDDENGRALLASLASTSLDTWSTSISGEARVKANNISYTQAGLQFNVVEGVQSIPLQTTMIGDYNVSNLLGVVAAMRALGISLQDAVDACKALTAVPGRMECIIHSEKPAVVVDYAHTPDALKNALSALRRMAVERGGKLVCIFGCGGNRDASKRPLMASLAEMFADKVCVTNDNPRDETPEVIIQQVMQGFKQPQSVRVEQNRSQAILDTVLSANKADVILIAGKGHENYQEVKGEKRYFSDKEQALHALSLSAARSHAEARAERGVE